MADCTEDKETERTMALIMICDFAGRLRDNLRQAWQRELDASKPTDDEVYSVMKRGEVALRKAAMIHTLSLAGPYEGFHDLGSREKLKEAVNLVEQAIKIYERA